MPKKQHDKILYICNTFGYSTDSFMKMHKGDKGEGRQMQALTMEGYSKTFIQNVKNKTNLSHIGGILYLTIKRAEDLFRYRRGQIQAWNSESKALLRECIVATPECFVFHKYSQKLSDDAQQKLFPQPSQPSEDICEKCCLKDSCKKNQK